MAAHFEGVIGLRKTVWRLVLRLDSAICSSEIFPMMRRRLLRMPSESLVEAAVLAVLASGASEGAVMAEALWGQEESLDLSDSVSCTAAWLPK